jgi:hypothetical protein
LKLHPQFKTKKRPKAGGERIDLHGLFLEVCRNGGIETCNINRSMNSVAKALGFDTKRYQTVAWQLKTHYMKLLLPLEPGANVAVTNVHNIQAPFTKRSRCKSCKACLRKHNCGKCKFCLDSPKYVFIHFDRYY